VEVKSLPNLLKISNGQWAAKLNVDVAFIS
jgi:hypothetical protein